MTKPKQPWRCRKCNCLGVTIPRATPRSKLCAWCVQELRQAGLRWCSKCRQGQPADMWASAKKGYCRACQRTHNQQWRAAHHEEATAASRAYYAEHREELLANNRAYYQKKRHELLEQKRDYYARKRELLKRKSRMQRRRRRPESIAKERARHQAKRHIYKTNQRAAALRRKAALWQRMIGRADEGRQ